MTPNPPRRSRRTFLTHAAAFMGGTALGGAAIARLTSAWSDSQDSAPHPLLTDHSAPPLTVELAGGMRLHHLRTGSVAVKRSHRAYSGPDGSGFPAIFTDPLWTEWLPVSAWVIEHPEGVIVVDTGETFQAIADPDYFACDPVTQFIHRSILRLALTPDDEIVPQMAAIGLRPSDVRWVVQTHLHADHMGGLIHFGGSTVIVPAQDYPAAQGTLPCRYPADFSPAFPTFTAQGVPGFERAMALTQAGDVLIVPTPGHTDGHQSVIVLDGERAWLLAGDASFDQAQLQAGGTAGIAMQPALMRRTLAQIRTYAAAVPTVYLPAHDPDLRGRMTRRDTVPA